MNWKGPGGRPETLGLAWRRYWKHYLPAMVYPVYIYALLLSGKLDSGGWRLFLLTQVPFLAVFLWATVPHMRRQVHYRHTVILGMLGPFLIWCLCILLPWLILGGLYLVISWLP